MQGASQVDQLSPSEAFDRLRDTEKSALVDVRTRAEWAFVGLPDLVETGRRLYTIEWVGFPDLRPNQTFYEELRDAAGDYWPDELFFICRSGSRSLQAARYVAERAAEDGREVACHNVAEGFEGDLDGAGHRGRLNGWKQAGLPWRQN